MFVFKPTSFNAIRSARTAYLKTTIAALDGMWEDGFFSAAKHWNILLADETVGYCALDGSNAVLGFQTFDQGNAGPAFQQCLRELEVSKAFVSTAEPVFLSLCLDCAGAIKVNALMYEDAGREAEPVEFRDRAEFRLVDASGFEPAITFGLAALGCDQAWLEGYYAQRIERNELFGLWDQDQMIAAGELRISESQAGVADVGVVVAPEFRRRRLATQILSQLRSDARARGLRVICSTERENTSAQAAIVRAGFQSSHRILEVDLNLTD